MSPARALRLGRTRDVLITLACIVGLGYGFGTLTTTHPAPEPVPSFTPMQLPTLDVK